MSLKTSIKTNLIQNCKDFDLRPLNKQLPLFKFKYLKKVFNAPCRNIYCIYPQYCIYFYSYTAWLPALFLILLSGSSGPAFRALA